LSAYESNPYAYQQVPNRQPRISRKMRVKTPNINNSKSQHRSKNKIDLSKKIEGKNRPTTAVGANHMDNQKEFVTNKGRRFLGSAKPGQRRKLRANKILNIYDNDLDDEFGFHPQKNNMMISSNEGQFLEFSHKFQPADIAEEFEYNKCDINNRPPSRQKEPSLALEIESEYGDDAMDEEISNKISQDIVLTTGIPVPMLDFNSKFTPAQGKVGAGIDLRPPSRQKTPTKAIGLDDDDEEENMDRREAWRKTNTAKVKRIAENA
jgi:hypothetical protein